MHPRLRLLLATALLMLMAVAVHWPATRCGYIWDDNYYVQDNAPIHAPDGLRSIWFEVGATPQYYPMVFTTFWIEYRLWGLDPAGYHVVNILLHALGAVLLWRVLRRLGVPGAWVAAAVFAVHPVHVESVAWITERKNVLSGVLYFGAALAYLHYARLGPPEQDPCAGRGSRWFYALALALFIGALGSKTVTCSLPAALLLVTYWKVGRIAWRDVWPLLPFFAVGIASGLLTAWVEVSLLRATGPEWDHSFVERCLIAGRALWFYAAKIVWPESLAFVYPRWTIDAGAWWQYLYPAAAAAAVAVLWLVRKRAGRGPLVAVLFFAGTLVPALGFFNVYPHLYSFVADHFQYLASVGLIALGVGLGFEGARRLGRHGTLAAGAGSAIVLALLGGLSWHQASAYADRETLWRDTIAENPGAWIAYNNLGTALQEQGRVEEAIACYQKTLSLAPQYVQAYLNLGGALQRVGRLEEAIEYCRQALRMSPDDPRVLNNLGAALLTRGEIDEASVHLRRALESRPDFARAHNNLGLCLRQQGDRYGALQHFQRAAQLEPGNAMIQANLGVTLQDLGASARALEHLRRAVALRAGDPRMQHALGVAFRARGDLDAAMEHFHRALELQPDHPGACAGLGDVLTDLGRYDEAIVYYRESLRIRPDQADVRHALGTVLVMSGKVGDGLVQLQEAVRLDPDGPAALNDLAWIRATFAAYRRPDEAIRLAEAANAHAESPDAAMLDTLAAAYAAGGRFDEAVTTAQAALARAAGNAQQQRQISARLALYRQGRPYVAGGEN